MKYAKKFFGFHAGHQLDDIIRGSQKKPCLICGEPTEFVEICSEGHFCSEECMNEWYDRYNEACRETVERGGYNNTASKLLDPA